MTTPDSPDLRQLADYEIVGELSGRDDAKVLLATRREDRRPVLITIARASTRDRGNALSHLAADANLLAATPHPNVLRVLEGRWLASDAFALVTERPASPTLEEMLTRRAEEFPYARVAAVLRDVNAALEWARGQKVVHRGLRLDTVYVEPGSDDVQVSFAVTDLPATGMPGADADARTIASLARAMLTRSVMDPARDRLPLAELRPGLPARVVQQTDAMFAAADRNVPDVSGYIAAIAMAEDLKRAEVERENVRREIEAEQQRIRAELAAEREAHDRDLAAQARAFAEERDRDRQALDRQRKKDEREIARLRATLEKERQQLARERESLARERAAFQEQATLPPMDHGQAAPEPYDELVDDNGQETLPALTAGSSDATNDWRSFAWADRVARPRTLRNTAVALLILVIVVGATAVALWRRSHGSVRVASRSPVGQVMDSVAGSVASPIGPVDSAQLAPGTARTEETRPTPVVHAPVTAAPRPVERVPANPRPAGLEDSTPATPVPERQFTTPTSPTMARADSLRPLPFTRPDSVRSDTAMRLRLDSLARIVVPKPDSLLPRRDTMPGTGSP